jgi:D-3-phosphoglycerate dehydrogenase / 2-oxoglutarate reductase
MKLSLAKDKIKVLLLEGVHENAVAYFKKQGYSNIEYHKKALEENELKSKLATAHIVGIRSRTQLTQEVLKDSKRLIAVGAFCIGTNQIDLDAAEEQGIPVFNAPYSNTRSVAELILAEMVMLLRGIPEKNMLAHQGGWGKSAENSFEARGKKLGIIGYGHIGSQVSVLAEGLGMEVCYFDIEKKLSIGNARSCTSLQECLADADIVTLHVPGTELTKEMMGKAEFAAMKQGSYLINASRGNVVVIPELKKALQTGKLLGAAIDVFPQEPRSKEDEFISELRDFDNVLLTPHIGGSTKEAQESIATEVAEKLVGYSDVGTTIDAVNFPHVQLPPNEQRNRFLHIHKNVPGVMENINKVFASKGVNVAGQYLQTDPKIGYVVIGVDPKGVDKSVLEDLKKVPNTIKARMLY